jgi:transposase
MLAERVKRLRTVSGGGPITALTCALEIGDVSRFRTIKQLTRRSVFPKAGSSLL